jgi:hypothetical protein
MRKVIRPDAEEERASVLRLAKISSDLTQKKNAPAFFDLQKYHQT